MSPPPSANSTQQTTLLGRRFSWRRPKVCTAFFLCHSTRRSAQTELSLLGSHTHTNTCAVGVHKYRKVYVDIFLLKRNANAAKAVKRSGAKSLLPFGFLTLPGTVGQWVSEDSLINLVAAQCNLATISAIAAYVLVVLSAEEDIILFFFCCHSQFCWQLQVACLRLRLSSNWALARLA